MDEYEMMQWAGIGVGLIVFAGVVFLGVRWFRAQGALFPDAAKHYGLEYAHDKQGSAMTNLKETERLQGAVDGIPLQVASIYETRGRTRMRSTWVATRAPAGALPCTVNITRAPPAAKIHLVPTGDAAFDRQRFATCDRPEAARALLGPEVRAQLLRCPHPELRLVVDGGNAVLSFGGSPSNEAELRSLIDTALALARSGTA